MQRVVVDTDVNRSWSLTLTDSEVDGGRTDAARHLQRQRHGRACGHPWRPQRARVPGALELVRHPGLVDPRPVAAAVG